MYKHQHVNLQYDVLFYTVFLYVHVEDCTVQYTLVDWYFNTIQYVIGFRLLSQCFYSFSIQPSTADLKLTKDVFMYRAYLAGVSNVFHYLLKVKIVGSLYQSASVQIKF